MTRRGSKEPSPDNKKQVWLCPRCTTLHQSEARAWVCLVGHQSLDEKESE